MGAGLAGQLVPAALLVAGGVALADVPDAAPVVSIRRVVDLPAPLGPRNATSSPGATSRSRPRTASIVCFLRVKRLLSPRVRIMGVSVSSLMEKTLGSIAVRSCPQSDLP